MAGWPILSLTIFLPLAGAVLIFLIRGTPELVVRNARNVALWTSCLTFVLSLFILTRFEAGTADFQLVEYKPWFPALNIAYHVGVDGISLWFVLLSTFLVPLCILASWESITSRVKEFMIAFLVLETMLVGMFCALDFVLFYLFYEGVLIPMFLIIGMWGGPRRIYSAFKFFLYTLLGSVLMLVAILIIYLNAGSASILDAHQLQLPLMIQLWLWLAFFASFAVKVPMWPLHTWLPDAHVEAPTAGSVVLAGVLLKMGGYGFLRFSIPILPEATAYFAPFIFALSVIAIIYTSLVALAQQDMKKLIAYSSVAHMGFATMGMFTLTVQGVQGSIFQMLSHGVISASLFLLVGVIYDRAHSRQISDYGGLVNVMPMYAAVLLVMTLASIGLPGTSGFVGEFLTLVGAFQVHRGVAVLAALGIILGACYMLWLYRRVMLGELSREKLRAMPDLNTREVLLFAPLLLAVIWLGVYPKYVLDLTQFSSSSLTANYHQSLRESGYGSNEHQTSHASLADTTRPERTEQAEHDPG